MKRPSRKTVCSEIYVMMDDWTRNRLEAIETCLTDTIQAWDAGYLDETCKNLEMIKNGISLLHRQALEERATQVSKIVEGEI